MLALLWAWGGEHVFSTLTAMEMLLTNLPCFFCMAESRRLLAAKFAQAISDAAEAASSPAISGMDRARKAYEGLQFDFPLVEAEDLLALAIRLR